MKNRCCISVRLPGPSFRCECELSSAGHSNPPVLASQWLYWKPNTHKPAEFKSFWLLPASGWEGSPCCGSALTVVPLILPCWGKGQCLLCVPRLPGCHLGQWVLCLLAICAAASLDRSQVLLKGCCGSSLEVTPTIWEAFLAENWLLFMGQNQYFYKLKVGVFFPPSSGCSQKEECFHQVLKSGFCFQQQAGMCVITVFGLNVTQDNTELQTSTALKAGPCLSAFPQHTECLAKLQELSKHKQAFMF